MKRTKSTSRITGPVFLVEVHKEPVIDAAVYYAAKLAKKHKGCVGLLYIMPPVEMRLTPGVEELMAVEERQKGEALLATLADEVKALNGAPCCAYVRQGHPQDELFAQIEETPKIAKVILSSHPHGEGIGTFLAGSSKKWDKVKRPLTVIPNTLSFAELDKMMKSLH